MRWIYGARDVKYDKQCRNVRYTPTDIIVLKKWRYAFEFLAGGGWKLME